MTTIPRRIALWKGRPIDELSREELIEALNTMGNLYEQEREQHMRSVRFLTDCVKAA